MKFYLHKFTAKRFKNSFKINEYSIKEFDSYKKAYASYLLEDKCNIDTKVALRITTTKKKIKGSIYNKTLMLSPTTGKYICYKEHIETDVEYGLAHEVHTILDTNYQKACDEFLYEMKKYENKRDSFKIEIKGEN